MAEAAEPFVLHINPSSAANSGGSSSLIPSLADQKIVLQIGQSSHDHQQSNNPSTTPPPHGNTLNLKVTEPILLHINSLTPLLNQNYQVPTSSSPPVAATQDQLPPPPAGHDQQEVVNNINQLSSLKGKKHQKALSRVGSLANLLPTGTVLAFQAITPSLSYNGRCQVFNKYLVACVVVVCSIICFLSSFTDSYKDKGDDGKVYYGIATFKGLFVFNYEDRENEEKKIRDELKKLQITPKDFVLAFLSVFVFLTFACSSSEVQSCYFPKSKQVLEYSLVTYLPLLAGILSSFFFTIFRTTRKGIGYTCS